MAKEHISPEQLELEERREALEARKIQTALNRLQLEGLQAEHEMKTKNKQRGIADAMKANEDRRATQARCNHHLGGDGALALLNGQGDENRPTTIGAQVFLDDTIRLKCNRCGKPWRSDLPNGDDQHGAWQEGVRLWRQSFTKSMMIVGGLKITKQVATVA